MRQSHIIPMRIKAMNQAVKIITSQKVPGIEIVSFTGSVHSTPRKFYPGYRIAVIEAGAGGMTYRGSSYVGSAGRFSLLPPGEVHSTYSIGDTGFTGRAMTVGPSLLRNIAAEVIGRDQMPDFPVPDIPDPLLEAMISSTHHLLGQGRASQLEQQSALLDTLAQMILRHAGNNLAPRPLGLERTAIRLVRDYLQDNYAESVSVDALARVASLSAFYLNRVFHAEVGLPPHAYQTQVRVERAKTLLAEGLPPGEVAALTGFYDQAHFTRQFRRYAYVTPGRYLQGVQGRKNIQYKANQRR